jgi:hypothetical protein
MIASKGALIVASFVLLFVAVSIITSMLPSFGINTGPIAGGMLQSGTSANKDCKCEFDKERKDFFCNKDCGDRKGTFCITDSDCV